MLISDRAKLFQLYEIYKLTSPSTEEWLTQRNNFIILFTECKEKYAKFNKYNLSQQHEMKKQTLILDSYYDGEDLHNKIFLLNTSIENKNVIYRKYKEYTYIINNDEEKSKLKHWLLWAVSLPYDNIKIYSYSTDELTNFLKYISISMDKELYGMKYVKEQILLFVSSRIQNPHMTKCSLGFIGSPGIGKTYISKLLSRILGFPFEQISLGGVSSSDYLKGHDYTYIGSQPGEIVKCLKRMKYKNGILFLDEFDKISNNTELCSALLHITDPVQNNDFRDNFLSEINIDLSYIWFIYSMNKLPNDIALRDRIYTIEVPGYSEEEKIQIILNFLLPRALKNINIQTNWVKISNEVAKYIIQKVSLPNETGIRTLEKSINNIISKIDFLIKHQDKKGKLTGFNISFKLNKFISYPITLTKDLIDILTIIENDT